MLVPSRQWVGKGNKFSIYVLDAMDPLILLLRCGGGDAINIMVPLHHSPISLCLTSLNQLTAVVGDVQFKAILLGEGEGNF